MLVVDETYLSLQVLSLFLVKYMLY